MTLFDDRLYTAACRSSSSQSLCSFTPLIAPCPATRTLYLSLIRTKAIDSWFEMALFTKSIKRRRPRFIGSARQTDVERVFILMEIIFLSRQMVNIITWSSLRRSKFNDSEQFSKIVSSTKQLLFQRFSMKKWLKRSSHLKPSPAFH